MDDYESRLTAKLAPESVGLALIRAGCFLSAYELISGKSWTRCMTSFGGFEDGKHLYDEARYQQHVLNRDPKSRYRASCAWLIEMNALTAEEMASLEQIHAHRQEIAHELPKLLIDPDFEVKTDLLLQAAECVRRLGVFWASIVADTDPQFDGQEVDYEGIKSGSYLLMEYLISLAALSPASQTADEAGATK